MQSNHAKVFAKPQEKILNWYKKNNKHRDLSWQTFSNILSAILSESSRNYCKAWYQFQIEATHKIHKQQKKHWL